MSWPAEVDRRAQLRTAGVPSLLVIEPGAPVPPSGPGEDWISSTADERDVSVRLAQVARQARPGPVAAWAVPLPPELATDAHRVAARLAATPERLVPVGDLPVIDLPQVIAELRRALDPLGYRIAAVGTAGYLLDRTEPSPP